MTVPTPPTSLPDVRISTTARPGLPTAVLARRVDDAPDFGPGGETLDAAWVDAAGVTGKTGEVLTAPAGSGATWVAGLGDGAEGDWLAAGAALARAAGAAVADERAGREWQVLLPSDAGAAEAAALTRGLRLGGYSFKVTGTDAKPRTKAVRLVTEAPVEADVERAAVLSAATALTRDLANAPSNVKDPAWLARTAARVAGKIPGLEVEVRDEKWLAATGFGGVLAVGGGSSRPPRLIEMTWAPNGASKHLVLVGKGITFDTGGISVKHADGMHLMRTDMAGGAAVIAAMTAIARLEVPVRVTALVPCAENHLGGSSYRPGDVVRHYGGRTTEVSNTDAEGRMVLADAMAYAVERLSPDLLVDVATLTGAMKVSLGLRTGGLFASSAEVARQVIDAGGRAGEAWWRMPLLDEYADDEASDIADVRQCPPGTPGGILAALFLREFTGDTPWAHLDIAGPARADKTYDDVVPGASGFAARTLVELAVSQAG